MTDEILEDELQYRNDELVAVEDSIDVGNVLWIFYDMSFCHGI